jgi:Outer membrane protein beta-barrel domain
MKKLIILSFILISTSNAFSQINFGVKAGYTSTLNMSNIGMVTDGSYNLNSVKNEMNNNFHIGGFARFGINKIYVQPELLYNLGWKKYTVSFQDLANSSNISFEKNVTMSTIDIPVLLGYKILDLKVVNVRAYTGPKFRFNAGSSMDFKNITGGTVTASNFQQDLKSSQVGLEAGVGVDVLMFTLDARYSLMQDMYQTKINNKTIDNIALSSLIVSLGFKF